MMEALSAESYKSVYPVYYDVALKNKYVSDPDAAEMIDIIVRGAGIDLAFIFTGNLNDVAYWFRDLINSGSTNIAFWYESSQNSIENHIQKIYAVYENEEWCQRRAINIALTAFFAAFSMVSALPAAAVILTEKW